jgi:hypothetical protein
MLQCVNFNNLYAPATALDVTNHTQKLENPYADTATFAGAYRGGLLVMPRYGP